MTSDIVSVEIGRSTWQGPAEEAPQRAGPITMTYRNYRGEIAERRIIPEWVGFGATDWHPEPQWLLRAFDLDKNARRDFALADCQFADLYRSADMAECAAFSAGYEAGERDGRASGQQVRALEWDEYAPGCFFGKSGCGEYSVAPSASALHEGEIRLSDVEGNFSYFAWPEAAKAAAQADYERRILAALTPAPRPEWHPDDLAVDRFAAAMKAKLAKKRAEGRGGWERKDECSAEDLTYMLVQHIWKGDPLDVGNLAMMLHQRGERIVLDGEAKSIAPQPEMRLATREELLAGEILAELTRARAKFPGKNVTFAALVEEVGELATATFEESADRVRKEAVQVAVMAMRMILDGDHCFEPWRAEKGLDPLDPEVRALLEGRDHVYVCESCGLPLYEGDKAQFSGEVVFCPEHAALLSEIITIMEADIALSEDEAYWPEWFSSLEDAQQNVASLRAQLEREGDHKPLDEV